VSSRRKALLIATDTYADRLFRELRGPGADVEALGELLSDPSIGGYSVEVLHNRPAHDVALAINGLFVEARRDDLTLLYVAGHGVKDDAGQLYLAMTNSRRDRLEATTVSAQFVRDQMTRSRSEYIAVWLDCCYAGAFPPGAMHRTAGQVVDVLPRLSGRGRAVMTASSALEYAYETGTEPDLVTMDSSGTSRGVFTDALIAGLGTGDADLDGDGLIDVDELYRYVYDQVEASPFQQTPPARQPDRRKTVHRHQHSRPSNHDRAAQRSRPGREQSAAQGPARRPRRRCSARQLRGRHHPRSSALSPHTLDNGPGRRGRCSRTKEPATSYRSRPNC
jgi:hypothetical protein